MKCYYCEKEPIWKRIYNHWTQLLCQEHFEKPKMPGVFVKIGDEYDHEKSAIH